MTDFIIEEETRKRIMYLAEKGFPACRPEFVHAQSGGQGKQGSYGFHRFMP